jgi:hypothetical protein
MKTFEIHYLNYEGNTPTTTVDVEDDQGEEDAKVKAIEDDRGCGDGIKEILGCTLISQTSDTPCAHRRLSSDITDGDGVTYILCLDCGEKLF